MQLLLKENGGDNCQHTPKVLVLLIKKFPVSFQMVTSASDTMDQKLKHRVYPHRGYTAVLFILAQL